MLTEPKLEAEQEGVSPRPSLHDRLRRINLAMTAFVTIYGFWLTSERTWDPDHHSKLSLGGDFFYWSQANSIMHGQVHVVTPKHWWIECFTIDAKCRGYFGIAPSILRVPAHLVLGDSVVGLVPLFIAMGIGLAFWAAMDLVRMVLNRYVERTPTLAASFATRWLIVVGALLGPGSVLVLLSIGRVYEEAAVWCAAFLILTLNLVYRWSSSRSNLCLYGAIVSGSMAALSRPSAIPAVLVLGAAIIFIGWRSGGTKVRVLGAALALIPPALYAAVFIRKFGSLSFPWKTYGPYIVWPQFRRTIVANHGSTVGFRFVLTTLANYLRPDSISLHVGAPWVSLTSIYPSDLLILPTTNSQQIWGYRVPSLTNVMPLPLLFTCVALVQQTGHVLKRKARGAALMPAFMLVAALGAGVPVIAYYAVTGRYLGDFYALMAVGTAFSLPLILDLSRRRDRWWGRSMFPAITTAAVASCFVLFQLHGSVY